jgi:hypothetical protein
VLLGNTPGRSCDVAYGTVTRYGQTFQTVRLPHDFVTPCQRGSTGQAVPLPQTRNPCRVSHRPGLASSPFAHHYSGNRGCFLFLRVLRCFTSPRYHHPPYAFRRGRHPMTGAGFPHSETPGSQLGCQLPGAYRRLQRPSSAPGAKASTVCPYKLDTIGSHYKHSCKSSQIAEDARVHCAVLKKQTEPARPSPIRGKKRPWPLNEENRPPSRTCGRRLFLQDPTACSPSSNLRMPVQHHPGG